MTGAEIAEAVNAAMAAHLDAAFWARQESARTAAAVNMATGDVLAKLPGLTADKITDATGPVICAIAEQSVYLLRNYDAQTEGKVVTSEGVEGLSVGYTLIGDAGNVGFAPRAMTFIMQAKQALRGKKMRFNRG